MNEMKAFNITADVLDALYERYVNCLKEIDGDLRPEDREFYETSVVSKDNLAELIEVSFWASAAREEGATHPFKLVLSPPRKQVEALRLVSPLPLTVENLAKLAPAVSPSYAAIGAWVADQNPISDLGDYQIWGITRLPLSLMQFETHNPGKLQFTMGWFLQGFTALIFGHRFEIVDHGKNPLHWVYLGVPSLNEVLALSLEERTKAQSRSADYKTLARAMRAHGHGGTLLIVPEDHCAPASVDLSYSIAGAYTDGLEQLRRRDELIFEGITAGTRSPENWQLLGCLSSVADSSLQFMAQLTAVDGATVVGKDLSLFGFGAKIRPIDSGKRPRSIIATEPFEFSVAREMCTTELGGTRHQSAAQFVYDHHEAIALVASEDGRLSVLVWNDGDRMVHVGLHAEFGL